MERMRWQFLDVLKRIFAVTFAKESHFEMDSWDFQFPFFLFLRFISMERMRWQFLDVLKRIFAVTFAKESHFKMDSWDFQWIIHIK